VNQGMEAFEEDGLKFYRWRIFSPWREDVDAVLTTRVGNLDLGFAGRKDSAETAAQRRRIAGILGHPDAPWAVARQIHSTRLVTVGTRVESPYEGCDGFHIIRSGVIGAVLLADCLPVLLYDPIRRVGSVSHSGWRGTVGRIAGRAVEEMRAMGSRLRDLYAAVGPGIGACCYDVGDDVADRFRDAFGIGRGVVQVDESGRTTLDLERANRAILVDAGLEAHHIGTAGFCTACRRDEFYSYRKESGCTERHGALLMLRS